MATDKSQKKELSQIARNIDPGLYKQLIDTFLIPDNVVKECGTAEIYLVDQYFSDEFKPWAYANAFRTLNCIAFAEKFEEFAKKNNFKKTETIQLKNESNPEKIIMDLLKFLKSELNQDELLALRESISKTFESIFADFLNLNVLTPSLEELRKMLQEIKREDLATEVAIASKKVSQLATVTFQRIVTLCLDTLDVDIFSLLSALREALRKEYSSFQALSMGTKQFSYSKDFIPLAFTKEVDTRTLPLTEGGDAELRTLMENFTEIKRNAKEKEKTTSYIDAHTEIYSIENHENLISLIGHPGTGKTFYCNKLINEYTNSVNNAFRFVLLLSCRNSQWHTIEEKYRKNPQETLKMLHDLLLVAVPTFHNSEDLVVVILKTEGSGLLLVIDSFDEFASYDHLDSTLLYKILKRQVLTKATILVTSRPGAWNKLLNDHRGHFQFQHSWQLIGFAPEERDQYILHMLSPVKAKLCHTFLANKPELNLLSLVPVNISLITGLVDSTDLLKHINTLTDAYTSLVLFTLNEELKRISPHSVSISTLQAMPADMRTIFDKLAEMCYKGLLARKINFSPEEFSKIKTSSKKYVKGLGLFQIIRVRTAHIYVEEYLSCPHLTIQEFLSAWHLAQKSPRQIKSIVQQMFYDGTWPAMKVCVRFLCGILTQGHNAIINIIIDALHRNSTPLLDYKYELFEFTSYIPYKNSNYAEFHYYNTAKHLSVLPYLLETNQPSIISSYYKLLCPANSTIPHFYLSDSINSVDTYFLSQYFSLLPPNSTISVLSIDLKLLNSIQIDMLANCINITSTDTLLVTFSSTTDTKIDEHAKKQYINDIEYEIQQLHVNAESHIPTLLSRLNNFASTSYIYDIPVGKLYKIRNIYELQYILSPLKLPITVSNSAAQTNDINIQKLFSFIRNIANASCLHTPKHIYYQFCKVSFMDNKIINTLIDTISSDTMCVMLDHCCFTTQFITTLVTSLAKLEYLYIDDINLSDLRSPFQNSTIDAISFQILKERNIKGLYLFFVTLEGDCVLNDYLSSQTTLQEIHLEYTTHTTLASLHAIQHLTSLKYLFIVDKPDEYGFYEDNADNPEESKLATYKILYTNRHTLSYVNFIFLLNEEHYRLIMSILSYCPNLQHIDLYDCNLTQHHMERLAITINQLQALLYINMDNNKDITDEGIKTLTYKLATHNTVAWISLRNCRLSSAPILASLIRQFPKLLNVDLRGNDFDKTSENKLLYKIFWQLRKITLSVFM